MAYYANACQNRRALFWYLEVPQCNLPLEVLSSLVGLCKGPDMTEMSLAIQKMWAKRDTVCEQDCAALVQKRHLLCALIIHTGRIFHF